MYRFFYQFFIDIGIENYIDVLAYAVSLVVIAVICFAVRISAHLVIKKIVIKMSKRTKSHWDDILLKKKFFDRIANLSIPIILSLFSGNFPQHIKFWEKFVDVLTVVMFIFIFDALINSIDEIYRSYEISNIRPIRGVLQVVKLALYIIGGIILVALLIGESPLVLLGGIGAMTAITSLIFKDSILGFVAGIQLSANDMVRIGDWIEMPKYSADGTVIDLSLTTVKVENFNRTITTIPAYALVSDAFINWRGMQNSGGRRIKRSIYIDASGIKICDNDMLESLSKIYLLKDYIQNKLKEIESYNLINQYDLSIQVNGRRMTNIGTFRAYILEYLKQHPGIHKDMTLMVRQLSSEGTGIPLEIYAFTNTVDWVEYEGIQSDIFDHLYSIAAQFGLCVFQQPSGSDIRRSLTIKS